MKKVLLSIIIATSLFSQEDIAIPSLSPDANKLMEANYQITRVMNKKDKKIVELQEQVQKLQQELRTERNITKSIKESLGDIDIHELQIKIEKFNKIEKQKKDGLQEFKERIKKYGRVISSGNKYLLSINGKVFRINSSIEGYLIKEINPDYIRFYSFKVSF